MTASQATGGSSRAGSSRASGAASGVSMGGTARSLKALRTQVFLTLLQLERTTERKWFVLRCLIEFIQYVGLVANAHYRWDRVIGEYIAYAAYGSSLPFFDVTWTGTDLDIAALILPWVAFAALVFPPASLYAVYTWDLQQLPATVSTIVSAVIHSCASILFVPIASGFANFFVCDEGSSNLLWHDESCGGALHIIYFVVGCIGLLLLVLNTHIANSLAFEDSWLSGRFNARSRPFLAEATTAGKLVLVICYHVLLSKGERLAFAVTGLCVLLALAVFAAVTQPFFVKSINGLTCALFTSAALVYAGAIVGLEVSDAQSGGVSFAIFFGPMVFGLLLGMLLPRLRRNGEMEEAMAIAEVGGEVYYDEYDFPRGLPDCDREFTKFKVLEESILSVGVVDREERRQQREERRREREAARHDGDEPDEMSDEEDDVDPPNITTGFIASILMPADVELASRVLREYVFRLDMKPTEQMVAFVARLYTKGLLRFRKCAALTIDFQHFLFTYAFQPRLALGENEEVGGMEPSLTSMYRAMKLQVKLKAFLNITDQAHTKTVKTALRLHKEVLGHMALFWSKLVSDKVDIVQLASVVNSITQRRALAVTQFRKALRFATKTTLLKYARFLEQVMHDQQSARLLTEFIADQEAERSGARKSDAGSQQQSMAMSDVGTNIMTKIDATATMASETDRSSNISRLSATMHGLIFALAILFALFFGYEAARATYVQASLDRIEAASEVRLLATQGAVMANELVFVTQRIDEAALVAEGLVTSEALPGTLADAETLVFLREREGDLREKLTTAASRITSLHNDLTRGDLQSSYGPLLDYMRESRVEIIEQDDALGTSRTVADLWSLGGRIGSSLNTIGTAGAFNTSDTMRAVTFLRRNSLDQIAVALNATVGLHQEESESVQRSFMWIAVGLTAVACLSLFTVYCTLVLNFASIGTAKLSIIGLFALIPRVHLESLHSQSRDRIAQFDLDDPAASEPGDLAGGLAANHGSSPAAAAGGRRGQSAASPGRGQAKLTPVQQSTLSMWDRGGTLDDHARAQADGESPGKHADEGGAGADGSAGAGGEGDDENLSGIGATEVASRRTQTRTASGTKAAQRSSADEHALKLRASLSLAVLSVVVLLMGGAALGVVVEGVSSTAALTSQLERLEQSSSIEVDLGARLRKLTHVAQRFTLAGREDTLEEYTRLHAAAMAARRSRELLVVYDDATSLQQLVERREIEDSLLQRHYIALVLAGNGFNTSANTIEGLLRSFSYNLTEIRSAQERTFAEFNSAGVTAASDVHQGSDSVLDATLPSAQQILVARALLLDLYCDAHFVLLERSRGSFIGHLYDRIADEQDRVDRLFPATMALMAAAVIGLWVSIAMLLTGRQSAGNVVGNRAVACWLVIAILALLSNIGVLGYSLWLASEARHHTEDYVLQLQRRNATETSMSDAARFAQSFVAFGSEDFFAKYDAEVDAAAFRGGLVNSADAQTLDRVETSDMVRVSSAVNAALRAVSQVLALTSIGVRVGASSYGFVSTTAASAGFDTLRDVDYDRARQAGEPYAATAYDATAEYSTPETDDSRTSAERLDLAARTLGSERLDDARWRADVLSKAALDFVEARIGETMRQAKANLKPIIIAVQALTGATVAMLLAAAMYTGFAAMQHGLTGRAAFGASSGGARAASQEQVLFGTMTRQVRLSLSALSFLFLGAFGFSVYATVVAGNKLDTVDRAGSRAWNAARATLVAQDLLRLDVGSTLEDVASFPEDARQRLELMSQRLLDERRELYEDYPWASFDETNRLFGDAVPESSLRDDADCSIAESEAAATGSDFALAAGPDTYARQWSATTADAMFLKLVGMLSELAHDEPITSQSTYDVVAFAVSTRDRLVTLELGVWPGLENSTSAFFDKARSAVVTQSAIHYAICGVGLALLVGLLLVVFRPMIARLLFEDDGTRLLLRMIPKTVRDEVPAIREYLEHGTVTQNEKLQRISDVVSELSTVAYVVMDPQGTVLRFSRAAAEEFGYEVDAVVGQNIKMLMPHSIAKNHDGYLRRYRETGVKHVVDRVRRVKAQRKDGSVFPVEIQVKEFKRTARESIFLGFVRDITTTIEFERATKLNEAVSDMAEDPIIIMDRIGTLHRVNRAATETFLMEQHEMVGKNIKALMPESYAEKHDDYLAAYQRTREKHIIDSSRRIVARRANGEEFPASVTVREMCDDVGDTIFFIGYLHDLTQDLLNRQASLANETVIANSPNPVIAINPQGTVLSFSPAAVASWGYNESEVVGQNIKMLMPNEIAVKHDGYLQRYQKTGEKRVVDATRELTGKRKDGTNFPCIANIKELRRGDQVTFIGYMADLTAQNRRLEQSRISELSLNASPVPIVITSDDGTIAEFNEAAERFWGHRLEEVIHKNVKMLMPKEVADEHDGYLDRFRETGVKRAMDSRRSIHALHKNEHEIECDLHLRMTTIDDVKADDGKRTMYIAFIIETAATRRLEKANLTNTAICDLVTVPMLSIDTEGTVLLYNRAAERTFGFPMDRVLGKNIKMLMPEDIAVNHDGYLERYHTTREKHVIDTTRLARGKRADGSVFPVELKIREVSKKGVDPIYVGYARDMTDEMELRDLKAATDAVLHRSSAPVIVIDMKGTVIRFSAAAERLFRWDQADIVGKNVKVLMPREFSRKHDEYLKRYAKSGDRRITAPREVTGMRRDGHQFPMELTLRETRSGKRSNGPSGPPPTEGQLGGSSSVKLGARSSVTRDAEADWVVPSDTLFIGYVRDMSMTHVLQRSNEMRDVVLDNSTVPMVQINDFGKLLYVNPACAEEFGYSVSEMLGQNVKMMQPDEVAERHDGLLQRFRETGVKRIVDTGEARRVNAKRRSGELFPIELSVNQIEIDGERRYVGYLRNIADALRVEDLRNTFSVITNLAVTPMVAMNGHGIIQLVNRACCEAFGYSTEELVGKNIKMLQPDAVASVHDGYLRAYRETGKRSVVGTTRRIQAKRRNGDLFAGEIAVQEAADSESGEKTFVGYIRDITERINIEVANKVSELTVALSPIPLITMDPYGKILLFSKAACDEFGYEASEVVGQNIKMIQEDSIAAQHDRFLERYRETGVRTVIGTTRRATAKRKNGDLFPVELAIMEVKPDGCDPVYVGFVRSLVEELQQSEQLRTNQQTVDLLPIPFIAMTHDGTIKKVNRAALERFGYEESDVVDHNVKMLMPEETAAKHDGFLLRYKTTGVKTVIDTTRVVTAQQRDGRRFQVEIAVRETKDELGNSIFFGFVKDISSDIAAADQVTIGNSLTTMSLVPLIVLTDDGTIIRFSESATATFGISRENAIGKNVKMLMPHRLRARHDGFLQRYRETKKHNVIGSTRAVPAVRADGQEFVMQLRVTAIESSGKSTLVGYADDISGRIKDETESAILTVINDLANVAVIVISELGIVERISDAACKMFEYAADDVVGRNLSMLMPQEIADIHDKFLLEYQRTKIKNVIDSTRRVTGKRGSGETFPIEIGVSELKLDGVTRFVGFIRDISDEVRREQEIGFSDAIFSLSTVPIIIADPIGRIVRCSNAIDQILGYSAEEVTGQNLKMLMAPEIAAQHDAFLKRYIDTGEKHVIDTTRLVSGLHRNGSMVQFIISVRELRSSGGGLFFAGMLEPYDESNESHTKTMEKEKAISESAASQSRVSTQQQVASPKAVERVATLDVEPVEQAAAAPAVLGDGEQSPGGNPREQESEARAVAPES